MTDGSLSHNVFDNNRDTDKNEILSDASIDQGTELTHVFHLWTCFSANFLQIDALEKEHA